nr:prepilin peptidase [Clostridium sp. HBUAS56010]
MILFLLGAGAFFDVREHRIPNWWVLFGVLNGGFLQILKAGTGTAGFSLLEPLFMFLLRMFVVTAALFFLFLFRMIGAGDIKMAALICGYLGFSAGAWAIGAGFLIGAFWSLIKMAGGHRFRYRFSCLHTYIRYVIQTGKITAYYRPERDGYKDVIPLGLCLFLGTFITVVILR